MKSIKKSLYLASLLGLAVQSYAAWNVISTFDDDSALATVVDQESTAGSNARSEIVDGKLAVFPGDLFEATSNLWTSIDLGVDLKQASLDSGGFVTFYYEIEQPLINGNKAIVDTVVGLSNEDEAEILTVRYNSYNAMARIDSGSDEFQGRNGGSFETVTTFDAGVTYSVWIVADYNLGYYELYVQGGSIATPTKFASSTEVWLFRVDPGETQTVDRLLISLSRGNSLDGEKGIDPTYLDNLAFDASGVNLEKPVTGGWNIISTFDDDSALSVVVDQESTAGSNARSEIVDGKLAVFPGDLFEATSNLWTSIDLGVDLKQASIDSGDFVTFYYEIEQPLINGNKAIVDTVVGLSHEDEAEILTIRYNSYNVMARIDAGSDEFQGRNGGSYETITTFDAGVSYSVWVVVDYNLGYYEMYVQGGSIATPTKFASSTEVWLFRVDPGAGQTVDRLLISLSRGNSLDGEKGIDPTYLDNLAFDAGGVNLTKPVTGGTPKADGVFGNYDTDEAGNVNTGDWLGWIDASSYPWVYVWSIGSWVYAPEGDKDAAGAWLYVTK